MSGHDDTRDRLITLEVQVRHLTEVNEGQARKIDEMYALMLRGQGGWWMFLIAAGFVSFVMSLAVKLLPWFFSMPK